MSCISTIDYSSPTWEALPGEERRKLLSLVSAFHAAPEKGLCAWMTREATLLGMSYPSFRAKYYEWKNNGNDPMLLVNKTKTRNIRAATALASHPHFAAELCKIVETHQRNNAPAFKNLRRRWAARREPIPGYETWPGWPQVPAGWSSANLARIVKSANNAARLASLRIGTSSKTNPFLPTVLTTRVGLWPQAVIQLDDVWHDNMVTAGKGRKPARVLELGALDLYSANRFHWGAKPRIKTANDKWENIGGADMRFFLAGMFHRFGYSPRGTMLMSEHNTAKVSEDIARVLYDSTGGLVRVDYQPIEGKQAALCGFWGGTEGGNFRAKACLEVTHSLMHNDLANLPMQTGSPSSGLQGPVTTKRIAEYITRVVKTVLEKFPERLELLRLPTMDFHSQFIPFITDYYEHGLNGRTDHELQGWEQIGGVISEYTTIPGSGQFFNEQVFLQLPAPSQIAIREAAAANPLAWMRRRNLSPNEMFARRDKACAVPPVVLCDMMGLDLAREVTARRGFLEFEDKEISAVPLIYMARFVSGPMNGREIPHGEKINMFALPFDDSMALVIDAKGRFLGEVPLYRRVLAIDPSAFGSAAPYAERPDIRSNDLRDAAGQKHARIADILEPSRLLHVDQVAEARDLREHNRRVASGAPVTPDELRNAADCKAAAARLQAAGNSGAARPTYDPLPAYSPTADPFAGLAEDDDGFSDSI